MIRIYVSLALFLSLLPLSSTASNPQGHFERTFQVSGAAQLDIDSGSSDFVIKNGPFGVITVSGKIHVGNSWLTGRRTADVQELEKNPPLHQEGSTLHVERVNLHNISIDYEITVPTETRVHSRLGSGDMQVSGLQGDLSLESGSGDVVLNHITGNIQLHSSSGDVRAQAICGPFLAEASSGDIRLEEEAKGDVSVHTGSGNIEITGVNGGLKVVAGSGDVSIDGTPSANWDAQTGSGNLSLHVPSNSGFNLEAGTSSGELHIGRAVSMTVQGNLEAMHHQIKGTVGSGGPTVTARTGSGDLSID